jgi:hypothetical protein
MFLMEKKIKKLSKKVNLLEKALQQVENQIKFNENFQVIGELKEHDKSQDLKTVKDKPTAVWCKNENQCRLMLKELNRDYSLAFWDVTTFCIALDNAKTYFDKAHNRAMEYNIITVDEYKAKYSQFETLSDWERLFPKSFKDLNLDYAGQIWTYLNDILDYFDEKGYNFENYKDTEYNLYWSRVNDRDKIKGNTRKQSFLNCLFDLLQDYENTL